MPPRLTGRKRIYTQYEVITPDNVKSALGEANAVHQHNAADIHFLFNYYRGMQPIIERLKTVRPDICYNTVVNHASEIVAFKVSYLLSDPIVYIARKARENVSDGITRFNDYLHLAGQNACDKELATDFSVCGQGYRFVYPNARYDGHGSPFTVSTLDPELTFIAYRNSSARWPEPVFGVTSAKDKGGRWVYDLYTEDVHYIIKDGTVSAEPNLLGRIPIIEYVNNDFRIGSFELVMDLLNAVNVLESNRLEATEQNVQALTWMNDVDLTDDELAALKSSPSATIMTRTVKGQTSPQIETIKYDLQQQDQQVLQNDLYRKILTIVGMPSMSDGNSNDSSNNGSTIVRNGWQHAEARAKDTAILWERSDRTFLSIALKICHDLGADCGIEETDIVGKFTRRNYEDVSTKATVLTTLLGCDKVNPEFAYQVCGLASDPEEACKMGLEWYEEHKNENQNTGLPGAPGADQRGAGNRQPGGT